MLVQPFYVEIYGNIWEYIYMGIYGNIYMGIYGNIWEYMGIELGIDRYSMI